MASFAKRLQVTLVGFIKSRNICAMELLPVRYVGSLKFSFVLEMEDGLLGAIHRALLILGLHDEVFSTP